MKKHTKPFEHYHATEESHLWDYLILTAVGLGLATLTFNYIFGDAITNWMLGY